MLVGLVGVLEIRPHLVMKRTHANKAIAMATSLLPQNGQSQLAKTKFASASSWPRCSGEVFLPTVSTYVQKYVRRRRISITPTRIELFVSESGVGGMWRGSLFAGESSASSGRDVTWRGIPF